MVKEHWQYTGCSVPEGYGPTIDGQQCYWFRCEWIGLGATTLIISRDKYWERNWFNGPWSATIKWMSA